MSFYFILNLSQYIIQSMKSKKEKQVIPQCTPEKEEAIMDALRHFKMI